jgi:hypothetical protein
LGFSPGGAINSSLVLPVSAVDRHITHNLRQKKYANCETASTFKLLARIYRSNPGTLKNVRVLSGSERRSFLEQSEP